MPGVHRDRDQRACGAATIASNPNVFVNNKLAAVDGNPNSHGGGALKASNPNVFVGNILRFLIVDVWCFQFSSFQN